MRIPSLAVLAAQLVLLCAAAALAAEPQSRPDRPDTLRLYVFGNSLVHYLPDDAGDTGETSVPPWLGRLAQAGGRSIALDGRWGFLRDFARDLPPQPNWSFAGVPGAWAGDFASSGYYAVILTPANFIQYQPPDAPYDGENAEGASPLSASRAVLDWAVSQGPGARFLLYEGWADMSGMGLDFPPDAKGLARYHAFNRGAYHDWFVQWRDALRRARPDLRIDLVPVASVLAVLMTETALRDLPAQALYSDDAPHGTATLYYLAALITHAALFGDVPAGYVPPETVAPIVREHHEAIAARILAELQAQDRAGAGPGMGGDAKAARVAGTLEDPKLAAGLDGIADWSSQMPFVDVMKTARPWIGHKHGQWGGWDFEALRAAGHLDPQGWPVSIPEDVDRLEAMILTDQPEEAATSAGRYVLRYEGTGRVTVAGRSRLVAQRGREIIFNYTPGEGLVAVQVHETDPRRTGDHIRNITVTRADQADLLEAGALFNPDWLARVQDLRALRFMDWMATNASPLARWQDRPLPQDFTYAWRGVPAEVMIDLANRIGADPWFTMPHRADDDFVRRFARLVRERLDPRLVAYVEYSNELWNRSFAQAAWAAGQADARWGAKAGEDAWMQFAGMRAAQVAEIWAEVFGPEADRRMKAVIATHTGWPGLEEPLLNAPLWVAEDPARNLPPYSYFDAYAVSGYFGYELGGEDWARRIAGWLRDDPAALADRLAEALRRGSLEELTRKLWPHHARVAADHGLELVMYEGGTHVAAQGDLVEDAALTDLFVSFNYSPQMAALYDELLTAWRDAGGTLFNAFVAIARPSKWGSWGALRHLSDENPRWEALMRYNAAAPGWEKRAPGTFANGVLLRGTPGPDRLEGTAEEDVLIAGPGDDVLAGHGRGDLLHGGPGRDVALLPGSAADWTFEPTGAAVLARGRGAEVRLTGIEAAEFEDDPGLTFLTETLRLPAAPVR